MDNNSRKSWHKDRVYPTPFPISRKIIFNIYVKRHSSSDYQPSLDSQGRKTQTSRTTKEDVVTEPMEKEVNQSVLETVLLTKKIMNDQSILKWGDNAMADYPISAGFSINTTMGDYTSSASTTSAFSFPIHTTTTANAMANDPTIRRGVKTESMEVGLIVNVKFDGGEWYPGTVMKVKRRNGSDVHKICIVYEDGSGEECNWPDDDIVVLGRELMSENKMANGGGHSLGEQGREYITNELNHFSSSRSVGIPSNLTHPLQQQALIENTSSSSSSSEMPPLRKTTSIQMEAEIANELLNLRNEESTATTSTTRSRSISPNEQPEIKATTVYLQQPKSYKKSTNLCKPIKKSMKEAKPELLYTCGFENCDFAAKIRSNTKRHRANIHDIQVKWNKCEEADCLFKCKQKSQLKTHQANIHDINVSWYTCQFCSFRSKERGSVKRHSLHIHDTNRLLIQVCY